MFKMAHHRDKKVVIKRVCRNLFLMLRYFLDFGCAVDIVWVYSHINKLITCSIVTEVSFPVFSTYQHPLPPFIISFIFWVSIFSPLQFIFRPTETSRI